VQQILNRLDTSSWESYKRSLGEAMEFANEMGITEEQIAQFAQQFGSYLAKNISPDIPENRALKELWEIASPEEQRTIASVMMKLARNSK
jgi:NADH dehydrogenase FAD-containing subunit